MSNKIKKYYKDNLIAHISTDDYNDIYNNSISDSDVFWSKIAERISWDKRWNRVSDVDYTKAHIRWFEGGKLNACYNCLDRHVEKGDGDKIALIWEGNDPSEDKKY